LGRDTILCNSDNILLDATNSNSLYTWQNGSTQPQLLVNSPGTYHVAVNKNGCYAFDTIKVNYDRKPVFNLGPDRVVCNNDPIILDPGIPNASLLWQDGSTASTYLVRESRLYSVTVTNTCGVSSDSVLVQKGGCQVFVPNSFTPDGNGKNDQFRPWSNTAFNTYHFIIFSRYGETVFQTNDPSKGWDGNYKGKKQQAGTYVWKCIYQIGSLMKNIETGTVILLR
jgi:gliding motility-associated-like protein